jgi:hypothetical protein
MNLTNNIVGRLAVLFIILGVGGYIMILATVLHGPWTWVTTLGIVLAAPLAIAVVCFFGMLLYWLLYFLATGKNWAE